MPSTRIDDSFWSPYTALVREVIIAYQWNALNDRIANTEPSFAVHNFRVAAGDAQGEFGGLVFQDSDLAKWLEAVGHSLATHPDPQLEMWADEMIDLIARAQQPDGYINTYFTIKEPAKRWTNLNECHELYCAGHMMEAAVAYYQATGKRQLLDVMCRFADHIDAVFGAEPGKRTGYPGHQEIELALVKLYQVTGEARYLRLSQYFIDERGRAPSFVLAEWESRGRTSHWQQGVAQPPNLAYSQAHLPVREQTEAVGHAVRAVYMYSAMADLARLTGDETLAVACRTLWKSVTEQQMYITGGIGSTHHGEAFSFAYDLPNDTVYAETCASIGLIFFAHRMLQLEAYGQYADVLERALYNTVLAGVAHDGQSYFYVNPLEVWPEASEKNPGRRHVRPVRQKWFGCSCCPPNVARLLASLGDYIYTSSGETLYTHLYIGGETSQILAGHTVHLEQKSDYPWHGHIHFRLTPDQSFRFTLALRIPGWCSDWTAKVNGNSIQISTEDCVVENGYLYLTRVWQAGDTVELLLTLATQLLAAHPFARADAGKVAIERGPLVYCLEEVDNHAPLSALSISMGAPLNTRSDDSLPCPAIVIETQGFRDDGDAGDSRLYRLAADHAQPVQLKAIPYFLWGNRQAGEMSVWLRARY